MFVADRDGNILMHTGKDVAESAKIPQNLQEEMDSGKDIFLMGTMDDTLHDKYYIAGRRVNLAAARVICLLQHRYMRWRSISAPS